MGIKMETFLKNRRKYGVCSSWAIWNDDACDLLFPMTKISVYNSVVADLNEKEPKKIVKQLNPNVVLLSLNFAERDNEKLELIDTNRYKYYRCFHEEYHKFDSGYTSDPRLKELCKKIKLFHGAYMTDFAKWNIEDKRKPTGIRESNGVKITKIIKENIELKNLQVKKLITELKDLKCKNPIIVCFGKAVHNFMKNELESIKNNLGNKSKIIMVTHYSKTVSKDLREYVLLVKDELKKTIKMSFTCKEWFVFL